jgi:hypothetical protein
MLACWKSWIAPVMAAIILWVIGGWHHMGALWSRGWISIGIVMLGAAYCLSVMIHMFAAKTYRGRWLALVWFIPCLIDYRRHRHGA